MNKLNKIYNKEQGQFQLTHRDFQILRALCQHFQQVDLQEKCVFLSLLVFQQVLKAVRDRGMKLAAILNMGGTSCCAYIEA